MKVTKESLSRQKAIKLIWSQTSPDFRGQLGGKPSIMLNAADGGGLCTVDGLTDAQFERYLQDAIDSKNRDTCKDLAVKIFSQHKDVFAPLDLLDKNCGTINQWCHDFNGIRELVIGLGSKGDGHYSDDKAKEILKTVDHFEEVYNRTSEPSASLSR